MLTWFAQIIRSFFFAIDNSLYEFIETLYNLLIDISRTTILTQGDISAFAGRIQMLLGVFMLFKVSFSLITYIINPDEFSDKSKGFAKLGQNIIISLVFLVVTPYIFGMAYEAQVMILEDNVIGNLIFGTGEDDSFIDTGGQNLAFSVMIPFFRPDTGLTELSSCNSLYDPNDYTKFNEACYAQMVDIVSDGSNDRLDERIVNNFKTGVEQRIYGFAFRQENVTFMTNGNEHFVFDYKILISSAAAIIVILVLITFCMDVGLRSVKLAFLQLISPIPIISYIDPKQGKDGMFKKWYTMCFSTYISLFVRLMAVYFGLYLINIVINKGFTDVLTAAPVTGFWINLFMIIGILMFVKQLPKILEGFGIKLDGGGKFTLNPFRKFENEAAGGKQILGTGAALGAGALAGAVNIGSRLPQFGRTVFNRNNWRDENGRLNLLSLMAGTGRTIGAAARVASSGIGGAAGATFRGVRKVRHGESTGKVFTNSYGEAMFAKLQREDLHRKGSTWIGRRASDIHRWTGTLDAAQQQVLNYGEIENRYKENQEAIKAQQEATTRQKESEKRLLSDQSKALTRINDIISSEKEVKELDEQIDSLTKRGGYYAHAGELNAIGRDEQAKMTAAANNLRKEEQIIQARIEENQKIIAEMKENGTYNSSIIGGGISSEASKLEAQINADTRDLASKKAENDDVIAQWQEAIKNNKAFHYKVGQLTEEGQRLKDQLDAARKDVYTRLKNDSNSEVSMQVEILHDLGMSDSMFEDKGSFNKTTMYNTQKAVQAIDAKYQAQESQYAQELRELTDRYEAELREGALNKASAQWKANEADHAADRVTAPQPGNFMPSPTASGANATYDSRYIGGYSGAGSSNIPGNNPPPPPRRGN